MRQKPKTAVEFVVELEAQPEYVARKREFEEKRQDSVRQHRLIARPVIEDLKKAGYGIKTLDELRTSGTRYESAVPVLLKWLPLISDESVKESIVRTLSVPWAKPTAVMPLIAEFLAAPESADGLKWAIGNALWVVGDDSVFDHLQGLVRDPRHSKARQMIVLSLGKMKDPRVGDTLVELLDDEDVSGHALKALIKYNPQIAGRHLERFVGDWRPWVKKLATKALA